jgi:hypothetical protein
MRIAYLADTDLNPNGFYRAIGPMTALANHGNEVIQLSGLKPPARFAAVRGIDVLHVHRYCDEQHTLPLIREAKASGAAVVWDEDDDFGAVPKDHPVLRKHGKLFWPRRLQAMKTLFRFADLVTAPSATLAERLRGYGAQETRVIENYIPGLFLQHDRQLHEGLVIGWLAAAEHKADAEELSIRADLERLLDERSDVSIISIGVGLGLASDRYTHVKRVPFLEWTDEPKDPKGKTVRRRFDKGGGLARSIAMFDIAIAPLADLPLNHSRSNVKLKEYAAGGAPWLASPVGPYMGMGEKQGGRLVPNGRWYEELSRMIDKERYRRKLAKRAAKWVQGETIEENGRLWEEAFEDAIDLARGRG